MTQEEMIALYDLLLKFNQKYIEETDPLSGKIIDAILAWIKDEARIDSMIGSPK